MVYSAFIRDCLHDNMVISTLNWNAFWHIQDIVMWYVIFMLWKSSKLWVLKVLNYNECGTGKFFSEITFSKKLNIHFVKTPWLREWDYERLLRDCQRLHEFEWFRECKNLFMCYSQINFCLDSKVYFASSALASTIIRLFGRGTSFQFHAFSALVVLNYSYCCPDCGVRIELACLF